VTLSTAYDPQPERVETFSRLIRRVELCTGIWSG
jgi:hypothetical protein